MRAFTTREEAERFVYGRLVHESSTTLQTGRCYQRWTETWVRVDGKNADADDVAAFKMLPRGQEHSVRADGPDIILNCACDSGD